VEVPVIQTHSQINLKKSGNMPVVPIDTSLTSTTPHANPLPPLLHTPAGLAILELQGTLHTPSGELDATSIDVGQLVFPLFDPSAPSEDLAWTKKVYIYVGKNQRMTGSVKKLDKALAVLKRDDAADQDGKAGDVKILGIVKWRIVFSARPVSFIFSINNQANCWHRNRLEMIEDENDGEMIPNFFSIML
jgi:chromosome transmission fidelity protein 8